MNQERRTEIGQCKSRVAGSTWSHELHQKGSGAGDKGPSQKDEARPLTGAQNEVKHFK